MGKNGSVYVKPKKIRRPTDRQYNTALFLLRCVQLGLSLSDLDRLDYGVIIDMLIESGNDGEEYDIIATQEDFDRF